MQFSDLFSALTEFAEAVREHERIRNAASVLDGPARMKMYELAAEAGDRVYRIQRKILDAKLDEERAAKSAINPAAIPDLADDGEAAFERRAAFGPGVDVVDIVTGKKYRT